MVHLNWDQQISFGSTSIHASAHNRQTKNILTGPLEQTNEPYAIAKIAGLKLLIIQSSIWHPVHHINANQPYGPNDNYDLSTSHMLAALLRKAHEAKIAGVKALAVWDQVHQSVNCFTSTTLLTRVFI